jgi:hypothetical protein
MPKLRRHHLDAVHVTYAEDPGNSTHTVLHRYSQPPSST